MEEIVRDKGGRNITLLKQKIVEWKLLCPYSKSIANIDGERWADIEGMTGLYQISDFGRLKRLKNSFIRSDGKMFSLAEKIVGGSVNFYGYRRFTMYDVNHVKKSKLAHVLVGLYFVDNLEGKPEVNHLDGNKLNNYYKNLQWSTTSENQEHAYMMGLMKSNPLKGEKSNFCKYSDKEIQGVMDLISNGESGKDISKKTGMSQGHISNLKNKHRRS